MDVLFERADWLYAGLVLLVALIPGTRFRALGAAGLGLVLLAAASGRVGGPSSGTTFATVNELLVLLGGLVVVVAGAAGFRRGPGASPDPALPRSHVPSSHLLLLIGLTLSAAGPHLLLVELGILLALVSVVRAAIRSGRRGWLTALAIGGGITAAGCVLATTILGPGGGDVARLPAGPFSPAAERLLVLLFGAGTLMLAGLPPLHRAPWGVGLAPIAAIVMGRVALPALPSGVVEWQTLFMLLLAGATVWAALTRRWAALSVAAGLASLWSGIPSGVFAAELLVLWGWLLDVAARGRLGPAPRLPERWAGLLLLVPALAALPALEAGLRAQVVLSVAVVMGVVAASVREFRRRPQAAHPPLY